MFRKHHIDDFKDVKAIFDWMEVKPHALCRVTFGPIPARCAREHSTPQSEPGTLISRLWL